MARNPARKAAHQARPIAQDDARPRGQDSINLMAAEDGLLEAGMAPKQGMTAIPHVPPNYQTSTWNNPRSSSYNKQHKWNDTIVRLRCKKDSAPVIYPPSIDLRYHIRQVAAMPAIPSVTSTKDAHDREVREQAPFEGCWCGIENEDSHIVRFVSFVGDVVVFLDCHMGGWG